MQVLNRLTLGAMQWIPTPLLRRFALRYIAGERLQDALTVLERLQGQAYPGVIDLLGEGVEDEAGARDALTGYLEAADAVAQRGLDAHVSVKPTHLGLGLSEELCHALYDELAQRCRALDLYLRVEMEDSSTTDGTLRLFERLRAAHANVGIVLQSRLLRTPDDVDRLAGPGLDVRLVKGIYLEPREIAHTDADAIRDAFVACTEQLFHAGASVRLATHDEALANRCLELVRRMAVPPSGYEFQVLLGVQQRLWRRWKAEGHTVRVYVPYGPDWRAYSTRRFRENPEILRHVMRDLLSA